MLNNRGEVDTDVFHFTAEGLPDPEDPETPVRYEITAEGTDGAAIVLEVLNMTRGRGEGEGSGEGEEFEENVFVNTDTEDVKAYIIVTAGTETDFELSVRKL